jgi:hypothetical protein
MDINLLQAFECPSTATSSGVLKYTCHHIVLVLRILQLEHGVTASSMSPLGIVSNGGFQMLCEVLLCEASRNFGSTTSNSNFHAA